MSVVKPKPEQLLWPITTGADNPKNQLELKVNTCNWRQARENAREQVTICFSVPSDWLRKWREMLWPITNRSNVKPINREIAFDTQLKTAL